MGNAQTKTAVRIDIFLERVVTPIGPLLVASDESHLLGVQFGADERRLVALLSRQWGHIATHKQGGPLAACDRLERYFAGELTAIDDIPVATNGAPFESSVWEALRTIPVGTVTTYGAMAVGLGHTVSASRAVGLANGANPIPIVLPCHRVIGANGNLTGYGGGMDRKRWLLHHEGVLLVAP